jgi:hypothetical protein
MTQNEQQIIETLISAMKGNNLVEFKYDGQNRIVEPYLLGELYNKHQTHFEEGTYALRAWFVRGYSSQSVDKRQGDRWRKYEIIKMFDLVILDETAITVRPLYNPYDKDFKRTIFRVEIKQH